MKALIIEHKSKEIKIVNVPSGVIAQELKQEFPDADIFCEDYTVREYDFIKTKKSFILQNVKV